MIELRDRRQAERNRQAASQHQDSGMGNSVCDSESEVESIPTDPLSARSGEYAGVDDPENLENSDNPSNVLESDENSLITDADRQNGESTSHDIDNIHYDSEPEESEAETMYNYGNISEDSAHTRPTSDTEENDDKSEEEEEKGEQNEVVEEDDFMKDRQATKEDILMYRNCIFDYSAKPKPKNKFLIEEISSTSYDTQTNTIENNTENVVKVNNTNTVQDKNDNAPNDGHLTSRSLNRDGFKLLQDINILMNPNDSKNNNASEDKEMENTQSSGGSKFTGNFIQIKSAIA